MAWRYFCFSLIVRFLAPVVVIVVCNSLIIQRINRATAADRYRPEPLAQQSSKTSKTHSSTSYYSRQSAPPNGSHQSNAHDRRSDELLTPQVQPTQSIPHLRTTMQPQRRRKAVQNAALANYTLFAVCALFIIALLPNALISLTIYADYHINRSRRLYCILLNLDAPFQMLRLSNYALNLLLYGLTGRQFRHELREIFRCQTESTWFSWCSCLGCCWLTWTPYWRKKPGRPSSQKTNLQTLKAESKV